jgi:hypothetical protein
VCFCSVRIRIEIEEVLIFIVCCVLAVCLLCVLRSFCSSFVVAIIIITRDTCSLRIRLLF